MHKQQIMLKPSLSSSEIKIAKLEARKLAIDHAHRLVNNLISSDDTKRLLGDADKIYEWLIKDL